MTTALELKDVTKAYGGVRVLDTLNLKVEEGEFICLLGPSGCGKTTLLRIIAGLLEPSTVEVVIRGRDVTALSPSARNIAMVFQSYALYPHKTVWENIAFPLRMRGPALLRIPLIGRFLPAGRRVEAEVRRLMPEAARMVGLEKLLSRRPSELSGGQKQRVTLARALVRDPSLFLMDEPLSNLDAKLRTDTRRIVLLNAGRVQQVGAPLELYDDSQNLFTAAFIGTPTINQLPGVKTGAQVRLLGAESAPPALLRAAAVLPEGRFTLALRAEHLLPASPEDPGARGGPLRSGFPRRQPGDGRPRGRTSRNRLHPHGRCGGIPASGVGRRSCALSSALGLGGGATGAPSRCRPDGGGMNSRSMAAALG